MIFRQQVPDHLGASVVMLDLALAGGKIIGNARVFDGENSIAFLQIQKHDLRRSMPLHDTNQFQRAPSWENLQEQAKVGRTVTTQLGLKKK